MDKQLCVICDKPFTEASPDDETICLVCDTEAVEETQAELRAAGIDPCGNPEHVSAEIRHRIATGLMGFNQLPENIAFMRLVLRTPLEKLAPYLSDTCTECDRRPAEEGSESEHGMIGRLVIIACEGYRMINPAVLGLPGDWYDWTKPDEY